MNPEPNVFTSSLLAAGYEKKTFFYSTGGGEDENDMEIWVKDTRVIYFDWTRKSWRETHRSHLNYRNGPPSDYFSQRVDLKDI